MHLALLLSHTLASAVFFPVRRTEERRVSVATYQTPAAPLATPVGDAHARALRRHGHRLCVERRSSGIVRIVRRDIFILIFLFLIRRTQLRDLGRSTRFTCTAFS